jgi:hypothetical protein
MIFFCCCLSSMTTVLFSLTAVEITRLRGLAGLYAVDIKRLKGSLWSFKYL